MKQLTPRQLQSELNTRGWSFVRMRDGSHANFKHPDFARLITIPMHGNRPIPPGLLRKILRDANIDPRELS